ncbi:Integrase core domain-containing protein [Nitrosomonas eutropha]|nr:integrase-like protein [Nitrosomonas eutropha]SCX29325.1 Integrase core domain-containing protein [Nitrosomonas eutropha]SEJ32342.1 Integrase core domain-containing protein [Nitrosomonas eutropha]
MHGFIGSMSRVGNCWKNKRSVVSRADKREDNVRHNSVAESFFGSLKQKQIHWQHYLTRYAAQQEVLQYISMFYNSQRREDLRSKRML